MEKGLKVVAAFTLFCFMTTQCVSAFPGARIEMAGPRELPFYQSIDIPEELGTVDALYEAPAGANPQFILHIQNAHANYQAQMKIKQLLGYMNKKYGFKTIFVEGASEKLDADYLRLFPDQERNLKLCDELAKQGELTGAELFLMEQTGERGAGSGAQKASNVSRSSLRGEAVEALGIEEASLYKANYASLKKVFGAETDVTRFFKGFDGKLDQVASRTFTPETRELIADWKRFEQGRRDFMPFVKSLSVKSRKILKVDLESLFAQVGWPQITRLLVIQRMEKDFNKTKGVEEQAALLKMLRTKGVSNELLTTLENFKEGSITVGKSATEVSPREVLERLASEAGPKGFKFSDYPAFSLYAGYVTLRSELDSKVLFEEIEYLFTQMLDTLTQEPEQKALLTLYRDGELLRKLLHLELNRAQWHQVLEAKDRMTVPSLVLRLKECVQKAENGGRKKEDAKAGSAPSAIHSPVSSAAQSAVEATRDVMPPKFAKTMDGLFTAGLEFYNYAHKREAVFYKEMQTAMAERKINKAILITGGFHTDGMSDLFRENAVSYGIVTPRLSEKSDENLYRTNMLQNQNYLFSISNLEMAAKLMPLIAQYAQGVNINAVYEVILNAMMKVGEKNIDEVVRLFNESHLVIDNKITLVRAGNDAQGKPIFRIVSHTPEASKISTINISGRDAVLNVQAGVIPSLAQAGRSEMRQGEGNQQPLAKEIKTILVVDDLKDLADLAKEMLEMAGFEVAAVNSAKEALSLIDKGLKPDALLTDVLIGEGEEEKGYNLALEVVKKLPLVKRVVFMSGNVGNKTAFDDAFDKLKLSGYDPVLLIKPFRMDDLTAPFRSEVRGGASARAVTTTRFLIGVFLVGWLGFIGGVVLPSAVRMSKENAAAVDRIINPPVTAVASAASINLPRFELLKVPPVDKAPRKNWDEAEKFFQGNRKAIARVDKMDKFARDNWATISGSRDFDRYIRYGKGDVERPLAVQQALWIIQKVAPERFLILKNQDRRILSTRFSSGGEASWVQGTNFRRMGGEPVIYVDQGIQSPSMLAIFIGGHEEIHTLSMPRTFRDFYIWMHTLLPNLYLDIPREEEGAYKAETAFVKKFLQVEPAKGDFFVVRNAISDAYTATGLKLGLTGFLVWFLDAAVFGVLLWNLVKTRRAGAPMVGRRTVGTRFPGRSEMRGEQLGFNFPDADELRHIELAKIISQLEAERQSAQAESQRNDDLYDNSGGRNQTYKNRSEEYDRKARELAGKIKVAKEDLAQLPPARSEVREGENQEQINRFTNERRSQTGGMDPVAGVVDRDGMVLKINFTEAIKLMKGFNEKELYDVPGLTQSPIIWKDSSLRLAPGANGPAVLAYVNSRRALAVKKFEEEHPAGIGTFFVNRGGDDIAEITYDEAVQNLKDGLIVWREGRFDLEGLPREGYTVQIALARRTSSPELRKENMARFTNENSILGPTYPFSVVKQFKSTEFKSTLAEDTDPKKDFSISFKEAEQSIQDGWIVYRGRVLELVSTDEGGFKKYIESRRRIASQVTYQRSEARGANLTVREQQETFPLITRAQQALLNEHKVFSQQSELTADEQALYAALDKFYGAVKPVQTAADVTLETVRGIKVAWDNKGEIGRYDALESNLNRSLKALAGQVDRVLSTRSEAREELPVDRKTIDQIRELIGQGKAPGEIWDTMTGKLMGTDAWLKDPDAVRLNLLRVMDAEIPVAEVEAASVARNRFISWVAQEIRMGAEGQRDAFGYGTAYGYALNLLRDRGVKLQDRFTALKYAILREQKNGNPIHKDMIQTLLTDMLNSNRAQKMDPSVWLFNRFKDVKNPVWDPISEVLDDLGGRLKKSEIDWEKVWLEFNKGGSLKEALGPENISRLQTVLAQVYPLGIAKWARDERKAELQVDEYGNPVKDQAEMLPSLSDSAVKILRQLDYKPSVSGDDSRRQEIDWLLASDSEGYPLLLKLAGELKLAEESRKSSEPDRRMPDCRVYLFGRMGGLGPTLQEKIADQLGLGDKYRSEVRVMPAGVMDAADVQNIAQKINSALANLTGAKPIARAEARTLVITTPRMGEVVVFNPVRVQIANSNFEIEITHWDSVRSEIRTDRVPFVLPFKVPNDRPSITLDEYRAMVSISETIPEAQIRTLKETSFAALNDMGFRMEDFNGQPALAVAVAVTYGIVSNEKGNFEAIAPLLMRMALLIDAKGLAGIVKALQQAVPAGTKIPITTERGNSVMILEDLNDPEAIIAAIKFNMLLHPNVAQHVFVRDIGASAAVATTLEDIKQWLAAMDHKAVVRIEAARKAGTSMQESEVIAFLQRIRGNYVVTGTRLALDGLTFASESKIQVDDSVWSKKNNRPIVMDITSRAAQVVDAVTLKNQAKDLGIAVGEKGQLMINANSILMLQNLQMLYEAFQTIQAAA